MQENNEVLKAQFNYSVENQQEEIAFKEFQKKYVFKGNLIKTGLFSILAILFLQQVITEPSYTLGYGLIGICLAVIVFVWYNPYTIRKKLLASLKELEEDVYEFSLYDDYFSVKTVEVKSKQDVDDEENPEEEIIMEYKPSIFNFSETTMDVIEKSDMFIVFIKKQTIYVFPKKYISEQDISYNFV